MKKDRIFSTPKEGVSPFEFNASVAAVFDDMIHRSVPLYREALVRQIGLAGKFYQKGSCIYDLGCSNGNFGLGFLETAGDRPFSMVAVDNSQAMIDIYEKRLSVRKGREQVRLFCADVLDTPLPDASVVVMNLTLQFLPVEARNRLVAKIHDALLPGGIFLLTEKVVHENPEMADLQQEIYYGFKAENGYSALEISQKREALENVLVPETLEAHQDRLFRAGFRKVELFLKWFHFTSFVAVKEGGCND